MKVFVPMSDELSDELEQKGLDHLTGSRASQSGRLVPFNPEFLNANARIGRKPSNWIEESDYTSACRRLRESAFESELVTA